MNRREAEGSSAVARGERCVERTECGWAGGTSSATYLRATYSIRGIGGLRSARLGELRPLRALPRKPYSYVPTNTRT